MEIRADDIITAMKCHRIGACDKCPYEGIRNCIEAVCDDAVVLVKKLGEENERLKSQKYMIYADGRVEALGHNDPAGEPGKCGLYEQCRANTVREMQAEIINRCVKGGIYPAFVATTIDKIAKEMIDNVGT